MIFEYKVILPAGIEEPRFVVETVSALLGEISNESKEYAEIELGKNYDDLSWHTSTPLEDSENLAACKMLPGAGTLSCFNVAGNIPYYVWLTDEILKN